MNIGNQLPLRLAPGAQGMNGPRLSGAHCGDCVFFLRCTSRPCNHHLSTKLYSYPRRNTPACVGHVLTVASHIRRRGRTNCRHMPLLGWGKRNDQCETPLTARRAVVHDTSWHREQSLCST